MVIIGTRTDNTLTGDGKSVLLFGLRGNDLILGYGVSSDEYGQLTDSNQAFAEALNGNAGDDVLYGGGGNDLLTGGLGTDTAVFTSSVDDATIVRRLGGVTVVTSLDGTDTLLGIEKLQLGYKTYDINGPFARSDSYSGTDNQALTMDLLANDTSLKSGGKLAILNLDGDKALAGEVIARTSDGVNVLMGSDGKAHIDHGTALDYLGQGEQHGETFSYTVGNGSFTDNAQVTLNITGQNDATTLLPTTSGNVYAYDYAPGSYSNADLVWTPTGYYGGQPDEHFDNAQNLTFVLDSQYTASFGKSYRSEIEKSASSSEIPYGETQGKQTVFVDANFTEHETVILVTEFALTQTAPVQSAVLHIDAHSSAFHKVTDSGGETASVLPASAFDIYAFVDDGVIDTSALAHVGAHPDPNVTPVKVGSFTDPAQNGSPNPYDISLDADALNSVLAQLGGGQSLALAFDQTFTDPTSPVAEPIVTYNGVDYFGLGSDRAFSTTNIIPPNIHLNLDYG